MFVLSIVVVGVVHDAFQSKIETCCEGSASKTFPEKSPPPELSLLNRVLLSTYIKYSLEGLIHPISISV